MIVKPLMVACLRVYVQFTLNYSTLHSQFESLLAICIKGFEDATSGEEYIRMCVALFAMRLSESMQQGDVKNTFRLYNQ